MKIVVATLGPPQEKPWWWKHIDFVGARCDARFARLVYKNRHSLDVSTAQLPIVMLMVLWQLLKWRRDRISHVFTIECDLVGLSIAFWQSLCLMRRPRHVFVQFIMRERVATFRSWVKYGVMRFLFRSVHRVVVSSTMLINVWMVIWPNQKKILGMTPASDDEKSKARRVAFLTSRANTMLSIPMLFFMAGGWSHRALFGL